MDAKFKDSQIKLDQRSKELRHLIIESLSAGQRGHVGATFSLVEVLRVLYDDVLHYDPNNPQMPERDRCVFSKGHGCLALYAILADKGFFPKEELMKFCKADGSLGGHPEHKTPGVEASTGSLGHGLSIAVGIALNARYEKSKYRVFAVLGDGECNEGSVWEAAMCASKYKLDNLCVLVDYNKHQSYGSTFEVLDLEPFADKWKAFGFNVREVDGHNVEELRSVLTNLPKTGKPNLVLCHTVKGKGIHFAEHNMKWHHQSKFSQENIDELLSALETY